MQLRTKIGFLFILFSFLVSLEADAQVGLKRLFSHNYDEGTMYFIGIKKLNKLEGMKKFEYDLTYLDFRDSVTVNFTVISPNPTDVVGLTIENGEQSIAANGVELLYHEVKGKNYVVRTTSKVPYKDFKVMMTADSPMCFTVKRADGKGGSAQYKPSQWKKEKDLFSRIIYLINK